MPNIYTELGVDYDQVVLPSITNEVLKAVVAKYNADELITKRTTVTSEITRELENRARNFKYDPQCSFRKNRHVVQNVFQYYFG